MPLYIDEQSTLYLNRKALIAAGDVCMENYIPTKVGMTTNLEVLQSGLAALEAGEFYHVLLSGGGRCMTNPPSIVTGAGTSWAFCKLKAGHSGIHVDAGPGINIMSTVFISLLPGLKGWIHGASKGGQQIFVGCRLYKDDKLIPARGVVYYGPGGLKKQEAPSA